MEMVDASAVGIVERRPCPIPFPEGCANVSAFAIDYIIRHPEVLEELPPGYLRTCFAKLPHEMPKFAVTSSTITHDISSATRLDAAIRRSERAKVIEAQPEPRSLPPAGPTGPEPTPAGAPMPRLRRC
jgi:hypothetical protein